MKIPSSSCENAHVELISIIMDPPLDCFNKNIHPRLPSVVDTHWGNKLATPISFFKVDPSFEGK